jgi:hypothetical protein
MRIHIDADFNHSSKNMMFKQAGVGRDKFHPESILTIIRVTCKKNQWQWVVYGSELTGLHAGPVTVNHIRRVGGIPPCFNFTTSSKTDRLKFTKNEKGIPFILFWA